MGKTDVCRRMIAESASLQTLPPEAYPPESREAGRNYIYISYAREDYRRVYDDLLSLAAAGVRFAYDRGMPASSARDEAVRDRMCDPLCVGMIFYLSEALFLSEGLERELAFAVGDGSEDSGKNYFCVNLAGMMPTKILRGIIRRYSDEELEERGIDERITELVSAFSDKATYIEYKEGGGHIPHLTRQLCEQFNVGGGEDEESTRLARELAQARSFAIKGTALRRYLGDMENVEIPEGVETIRPFAFDTCMHVRSLLLPLSLRVIDGDAFAGSGIAELLYPGSCDDFSRLVTPGARAVFLREKIPVICMDGTVYF